MKSDQNKFFNLSDRFWFNSSVNKYEHLQSIKRQVKCSQILSRLVMAVSGESGDTTQFAEYIAKNIALYKMRNGWDMLDERRKQL